MLARKASAAASAPASRTAVEGVMRRCAASPAARAAVAAALGSKDALSQSFDVTRVADVESDTEMVWTKIHEVRHGRGTPRSVGRRDDTVEIVADVGAPNLRVVVNGVVTLYMDVTTSKFVSAHGVERRPYKQ